jgi:hypothetical protein
VSSFWLAQGRATRHLPDACPGDEPTLTTATLGVDGQRAALAELGLLEQRHVDALRVVDVAAGV